MNLRIAARMTAAIALGAAMTAAFMALRGDGLQEASSPRSAHPGGEPQTVDLARCRAIGISALNDEICRGIWAENRRRFLRNDGHVVQPFAKWVPPKEQHRLSPDGQAERGESER